MLEWISNISWQDVLNVVPWIVTGASVIVKITPNETDNKILEKIIKFFEKIGLNTSPVKKKEDKI